MDLKKTIKEINKGREKAEAAFVFCVWKNPEFYSEYTQVNKGKDKTLKREDSIFFWQMGRKMYESGIRTFDALSIDMFLDGKDKAREIFESYGGQIEINNLMSLAETDNVSAYFDVIARMNALETWATKTDELFEDVHNFDNATSEEVYEVFEQINNEISLRTNHKEKMEDLVVDDKFIDKLESGENVGFNYGKYCPQMNYITLGAAPGSMFMIGGMSGTGKALALDEPILTPTGFKPMGEIKLGDFVIGEDGKKTQVIGVFPQGKRPAYRVTFENGTQIICDRDHLWKIKTRKDTYGNRDWRISSTGEMFDKGIIDTLGGKKFRIPLSQPIQDFVPKGHLLIPPYTLGALLGDGYLMGNNIQFTTTELDIVEKLNKEIYKWGHFDRALDDTGIQFIYHTELAYGNNMLPKMLQKLGLYGCKSPDKFIPEEYLYASYEDRLQLARGLMDTDGSIDKKGHLSFSSVSKRLIKDVTFLLESLGKQVRIQKHDRRNENSIHKHIEYAINVCGLNPDLVSSNKHLERYNNAVIQKTREYYYECLKISNIEDLHKEIEMQCIAVDNQSRTYLCRDFVVTHNTSFTFENMLMSMHYQKDVGKIAIISNEMKRDTYRILLLLHVLTKDMKYYGLTQKQLKKGQFNKEQKEKIVEAQKIIQEEYADNLIFIKTFDNDISKIMKYMKHLKSQGVSVVLFDTFKADDELLNKSIWETLLIDSRRLFQLCSKLDICLITTYQLALHKQNIRYLDATCLSNGKQIKEVYDSLIYLRPVWDDERDPNSKYYIHPWRFKRDKNYQYVTDENGKWIKEEITLEPDDKYVLFFIDKTRADEDKQILLYRWRARFNEWREEGYAKVINTHQYT